MQGVRVFLGESATMTSNPKARGEGNGSIPTTETSVYKEVGVIVD